MKNCSLLGFAALLIFAGVSCKSTESDSAPSNKDKIVGTWEVVSKATKDAPPEGTIFEFGKDGKLKVEINIPGLPKDKDVKIKINQPPAMPYEVKNDMVSVQGQKGTKEFKIVSLTDKELKLQLIVEGKTEETVELKKK